MTSPATASLSRRPGAARSSGAARGAAGVASPCARRAHRPESRAAHTVTVSSYASPSIGQRGSRTDPCGIPRDATAARDQIPNRRGSHRRVGIPLVARMVDIVVLHQAVEPGAAIGEGQPSRARSETPWEAASSIRSDEARGGCESDAGRRPMVNRLRPPAVHVRRSAGK
jgi:hypothetical protein